MFRKKVLKLLCMTLTASMIAGQPLMALAADSQGTVQSEVSTQESNLLEVPMTTLPTLEAGKTYTCPFYMYNASTVQNVDGKVYAE